MKRAVITVFLAGCVHAQRAPVAPTVSAQSAPLPRAIEARLMEYTTRFEAIGVRRGEIVAQGVITRGTPVRVTLPVEAGRCVALIAVATAGVRDLDARLFDPSGELVTEDTEPDAHPAVQICAAHNGPRRVWYVLEAFDGQGAFAVASYDVTGGAADAVARVVGGRPGVAPGGREGSGELERRVLEFREGIARRGFTVYGEGRRVAFEGVGTQRLPVRVTAGQCYTVAVFAGGEVQDAGLRLLDPEGIESVRDLGPDRDAFAQFCPIASGTWSAEASVQRGRGGVVVAAFVAESASVGGTHALWLGEGRPMDHGGEPLEQRRRVHLDALRAQGWTAMTAGDFSRAVSQTLSGGEVKQWRVRAQAGRCTAVFALADRGLGDVSVELFDAAGDRVAQSAEGAGVAMTARCTTQPEEYTVRVSAERGAGTVELHGMEASAPAWANGLEPSVAGRAMATIGVTDPSWRAVGTPERTRVGSGAVRPRSVERAAGRCVRVSGIAAVPFVHVALRADNGGAALEENSSRGGAAVVRCGAARETLRAELTSAPRDAREGDAVWMVWESVGESPSAPR